ncbi:hypothetical protein LXL04_004407 [Taraxacum kok-saghyz]
MVKTSAVCRPHLQPSVAEEVDQTSAVCRKKTVDRRREEREGLYFKKSTLQIHVLTALTASTYFELKEVPVFVEKSGETGGEIGGLNGRNRTREVAIGVAMEEKSHQRRWRVAGLKTGNEQRPMVEKDRQQKRTDGDESQWRSRRHPQHHLNRHRSLTLSRELPRSQILHLEHHLPQHFLPERRQLR